MYWALAAILAAIGIGSVGIWVTLIGGAVPAFTLGFLRVGLTAAAFLILCLFFDRTAFKINKKEFKTYVVIGFFTGTAMTLFIKAFDYLSMSQAYVLDAFFPFFTVLLMGWILKERLQVSDIVAIVLGAVAISIFNFPTGFWNSTGVAIMFAEIILYALMVVFMRKTKKMHTLKTVFWMFLFATVWLSPLPFIYGFGQVSTVWNWVFALSGVTVVGYLCFMYAVSNLWAEEMTVFLTMFTTSFAVLMSWLLFKEVITLHFFLGTAVLIASGVILNVSRAHPIVYLSNKLPHLSSTGRKRK